jgi:Holliday junction resolvasome RuvABC endonuclease subunit
MVVSILKLDGAPAPDAADALATALCHGHQQRVHAQLGTGKRIAGLR